MFSHGGGKRTAEEMRVHFLGELPLDPQVRIGGDTGRPVALRDGDPHAQSFRELAKNTIERSRKSPSRPGHRSRSPSNRFRGSRRSPPGSSDQTAGLSDTQ